MKSTVERGERTSARFRRGEGGMLFEGTRDGWGAGVVPGERTAGWARACATAGAAVWAGMAVLASGGIVQIGAIELMFLFGPLVIVPLGMELGRVMGADGQVIRTAQRIQPVGAALAVVGVLLPPGRAAGLAALGWMAVCLAAACDGAVRIASTVWRRAGEARPSLVQIVLAVGRIDLAVGGAWLVASRLGMRPLGIQEPLGLLTAVHFHFAGFATATIAAATLAFAEGRIPSGENRGGWSRLLRVTVLGIAGLPFLVAAGFVVSPMLKMTAAVAFSIAVAVLAVFLRGYAQGVNDGTSRVLLQVASGAVFAGMLFAAGWAVAEFTGSDAITIPQMVRTHGILNAVGFCLPGLLGWLVGGTGSGGSESSVSRNPHPSTSSGEAFSRRGE